MVFWCMLGGVRGAPEEEMDGDRDEDAEVDDGVDAADMTGGRG